MVARYEYETSPRKIYKEHKNKKQKIRLVENMPKQDIKLSRKEKIKHRKATLLVMLIFILLLTVSYRNAKINEKFNEARSLETKLASIKKENEQLQVSIENSLNYNNIEKQAKEKLGMQKLTSNQTVYVNLPKKDYVESATEKVEISNNDNESWFQKIVDKIFNR